MQTDGHIAALNAMRVMPNKYGKRLRKTLKQNDSAINSIKQTIKSGYAHTTNGATKKIETKNVNIATTTNSTIESKSSPA